MYSFHPGLVLILTGLLAWILPKGFRDILAIGGSVFALICVILLTPDAALSFSLTEEIQLELLHTDTLSKAFGLFFGIIGIIAGIYSFGVQSGGEKAASLVYAGSSLSVVFAGDWISLICFWEVMAVSSWYLVWAGKTQKAKRASYRYLAMHFFGGNMLLAGAVFFCVNGEFQLGLLSGSDNIGYWLVLIGVAVNGAIPPFHSWVADAYPESTPSGTVYMGSFTTKVAIYALIRLFAGTEWLVIVGGIMAVFAACMALIENDLRKLLSYHIVSQLGMMIAGLGTGLEAGIDGAALHAGFNVLYKGVLLMAAGGIFVATGKRKISELGGLAKEMPLTAVCFGIGSLAIAGMPFLNGFASKALIMEALHDGHFTIGYWLVMLAGVGTWLSITLKINYFVFFRKREEAFVCNRIPITMCAAMVTGTALCVITGIMPALGYQLMPYQTMGHPFSMDHILEYVGLFIGASIPFILLLKKMEPHDRLTLDVDWLYRKPLAVMLSALSKGVDSFFGACGDAANRTTDTVKLILNDPGEILYQATHWHKDEEEMPIGNFIWVFLIFCLAAFLVVGKII